MLLHQLRQLSLISLPTLLLLVAGIKQFNPAFHPQFVEGLFIILLTANIGYFTNFIAIKMLFRPHHKTALGRQGLIPKNQPKLAKALSHTLSDHFLASEHWQEYLEKADFIPSIISALEKEADDWLAEPKNQQQLQALLQELLNQHESQINQWLGELQMTFAQKMADELDVSQLLNQGFEWIERQFEEKPREMEFLIEPLVNTIAENVPLIATRLVEVVDAHIEQQDAIRRSVAKAAKWSANISEDDIRNYLFRMVASREFRRTLFQGVETLVSQYKNQFNNNAQDKQSLSIDSILSELVQNKICAIDFSKYLKQILAEPKTGLGIIQFTRAALPTIFDHVGTILQEPEIQKKINKQLIRFIEAIDLREIIEEKAAAFSPKTMENLFHTMIADQLVFIELLGALLGALSGLALVNMDWFITFTLACGGFITLDHLLTRRKHINNIEEYQTDRIAK